MNASTHMNANIYPQESILHQLRKATENLDSVVVSFEGTEEKFASYTDSLINRNGEQYLIIEPIAADALSVIASGEKKIFVKSSNPRCIPWVLTTLGYKQVSKKQLWLPLMNASMQKLAPRTTARISSKNSNHFVLIVETGTGNPDTSAYPIVDLSRDICCIEISNPWKPGHGLPSIHIIGANSQHLRTTSAQVIECIPWYPAIGKLRYRCRLLMEPQQKNTPSFEGEEIKDIHQIKKVLNLVRSASIETLIVDSSGKRIVSKLDSINDHFFSISIVQASKNEKIPNVSVPFILHFELFSVGYIVYIDTCFAMEDEKLKVSFPNTLKCTHRRWSQRISLNTNEDIFLELTHPLLQRRKKYRLLDVSCGGLSFEFFEQKDVFWKELILDDILLFWKNIPIHLGAGEVKNLEHSANGSKCRISFLSNQAAKDANFAQFLLSKRYPQIEICTEQEIDLLLPFYKHTNVIHGYMIENMPQQATLAMKKLVAGQNGKKVGSIFIHRNERSDSLEAAVMTLRAWENTYIGQHLASVGVRSFHWSGELRKIFFEHALLPFDAKYLAFFVYKETESYRNYYEHFIKRVGTAEAIEETTTHVWMMKSKSIPQFSIDAGSLISSKFSLSGIAKSQETLVQHVAERELGLQAAKAFSLVEGELSLSKLKQDYKESGLIRSRTPRIFSINHCPAYLWFSEELSAGLNLSWILNANWILPVRDKSENTDYLVDLLKTISLTKPQTPSGNHIIITPNSLKLDKKQFEELGVQYESTIYWYILNRSGASRAHDYVRNRHGLLDSYSK